MKILSIEQGSPEWEQARLGVITASEVDALVSPLWKIRSGEGVETYLYRKLAERLVGWNPDSGGTFAMEQGTIIEQIAVPWYNFTYDTEIRRVGFCVSDDGRCGCSPDGLIGDDNGIEIKSPTPPIHLKYLLKGEVPPEYRAQVHFSMFVTGRPKWTFLSYSRVLPPLVVRIERDEQVQEIISEAVRGFLAKFDAALQKLKAIKGAA